MQLVHYLILINLDQSGLPAERSREASRAALRPLLAFPSKSRTWKYLGKYLPQRARVICEAENTVCILRKSGDNWVILQNPSFITMGAAAAFNGPLSFPNWRRDHFAYSDEVPFPQDECVLHTLLHFYLLVVIVERRRRKEPSSIFLLSYIATTLPRSISLPWHAVFYESSSNSAEQCRIRLPHQQQQNSSLLTHATCKLDTFFIGFFSLRRHFFFK